MERKPKYFSIPDIETIRQYRKLSPAEKLSWLEESARFIYEATDEETRQRMEFFNQIRFND